MTFHEENYLDMPDETVYKKHKFYAKASLSAKGPTGTNLKGSEK